MSGGWQETVEGLRDYFSGKLWEDELKDMPPLKRIGIWLLRVASIVGRDFGKDNCLLRASALTYATLLSIVPLLAFAFAILKGLGVQNRLEPIILENLAVGSEVVVNRIFEYIENTNVARLGIAGLVILLLTVLALLSNIEKAFNHIWHVGETRSLMRRFADYFSVIAFGPLLMVAAISMTATLETMSFIQDLQGTEYVGSVVTFSFQTLPYIAMWIAFTFLLLFMPNIRVRLSAALVGGIFGGTLWQLSQIAYVQFQFGVSRYNAIYGTMAALPILLVWIYISWVIVLLGVEVTYTVQNLKHIGREIRGKRDILHQGDFGALAVLLLTVRLFCRGEPPINHHQIADRLELAESQAREFIDQLMEKNLLIKVEAGGSNEEYAYQPARAPDRMRVVDVLKELRGELPQADDDDGEVDWRLVGELADNLAEAEAEELRDLTIQELAEKNGD